MSFYEDLVMQSQMNYSKYYADTPSFRKHFGKYAEKYGFKGAFDGMYSFLQGKKYGEQYQKVSDYIQKNKNKKILFLELGVRCLKVWPDAGIPAPDLVDMGAFIAPHVLGRGIPRISKEL